jgi:hypothetical protein
MIDWVMFGFFLSSLLTKHQTTKPQNMFKAIS